MLSVHFFCDIAQLNAVIMQITIIIWVEDFAQMLIYTVYAPPIFAMYWRGRFSVIGWLPLFSVWC